jgi:hypothetical protein
MDVSVARRRPQLQRPYIVDAVGTFSCTSMLLPAPAVNVVCCFGVNEGKESQWPIDLEDMRLKVASAGGRGGEAPQKRHEVGFVPFDSSQTMTIHR